MHTLTTRVQPLDHPKIFLVLNFIAWKVVLLCIALTSPGPGYDTSTELLRPFPDLAQANSSIKSELALRLRSLVRWDAIYYTQVARRGYLWEQEWAFGWGFTNFIAVISKALTSNGHLSPPGPEALAAIILAHVFHLLSVMMLHELTLTVCLKSTTTKVSSFCVLVASLHIISPAGIFLSAPYAESPFSFLNFTGFYLYAKAILKHAEGKQNQKDLLVLISGFVFGIATTFRGNGLFSGLLFVWDALAYGTRILRSTDPASNFRSLLSVLISGLSMACIAVLPQYLAYAEYCVRESADSIIRPWCSNWPPSIYAWVQGEYWGVGFLNYWTVSNIPLFILATPMLSILVCSSIWTLRRWSSPEMSADKKKGKSAEIDLPLRINQAIALRLAIPQIILATLALTVYHVQIITRLSSGYPVWYWWLASLILENRDTSLMGKKWSTACIISKWMVIYAIVQGGLFASFLPPA